MCYTSKAKLQLKRLKSRTQNDLYYLNYDSMEFTALSEDILSYVRDICKDREVTSPLYKYAGEVKLKPLDDNLYDVLNLLASEYSIFFNIKIIDKKFA